VQFKQAGSNSFVSFVSFASNDTLDAAAIPEPGSVSMALMGIGLLGLSRRRKARTEQPLVGLRDDYNFDAQALGAGSEGAERATTALRVLSPDWAKSFMICYGNTQKGKGC
jgi:hypothetical protein